MFPALQHSAMDWEYRTEPSDRSCLAMDGVSLWPRGKVLGGSSVLNAMMYVRGNPNDYNRWASLGNPGWDYNSMLYYFKKSEDMRDPVFSKSPYHGTNGYLTVEPFRTISPLADITMEAARELDMMNPENDVNGQSQSGFTQTQGTVRDGLRCSTNKAFLRPVHNRPNLHISLHSHVTRVLIDPQTHNAYGVQFIRDGESFEIYSRKETIVSSGSINSPQLLMLSGVGSANHLNEVGVNVILDLPGVGENLQDHIGTSGVSFLLDNPFSDDALSFIMPKLLDAQTIRDFVFNRNGPLYGMDACEVMSYISTKYQDPSVDWPDLQIFYAAYSDITDGGLFGRRLSGITYEYFSEVFEKVIYRDSIMILPILMRPESRGRVLLQSSDPLDYPIIFANYFDSPKDLEVLVSQSANSLAKFRLKRIFLERILYFVFSH